MGKAFRLQRAARCRSAFAGEGAAMLQRFPRNLRGRDFAVGDIHGHFSRVALALQKAAFDPARDRLFSVGDLIDRGPECERVLEWLAYPWFFPVRGNHEHMLLNAQVDLHFSNGGAWFYGLADAARDLIAARLARLPLLIEVEVPEGLIGIVHADVPSADWTALSIAVEREAGGSEELLEHCLWSRQRIMSGDASRVHGISAVVVGHTPLQRPAMLGNVIHIDTGGWLPKGRGGYFTLLDLHSLQTIPALAAAFHLTLPDA